MSARRLRIAAALLGLIGVWSALLVIPASAQTAHGPTTPSGLGVSLVDDVVALSWSAPTEDAEAVTHYQVLRRSPGVDAVGVFTIVAQRTGTSDTTWRDWSANVPGRAYTYRVKAWRGEELSGWSRFKRINLPSSYVAPARPAATETELAPSGLSATHEADGITLTWLPPAVDAGLVTDYEISAVIFRVDQMIPLFSATTIGSTNPTWSVDVSEAPGGSLFQYTVRALRGEQSSAASDIAELRTPAPNSNSLELISSDPADQEDPQFEFSKLTPPEPNARQDNPEVTLVGNTGQTRTGFYAIAVGSRGVGQEFTTGDHAHGYELTSIEFRFQRMTNALVGLGRLRAKLHKGNDDVLCTLTKPSSLGASSLTNFTIEFGVPDSCETLEPNSRYFISIEMPIGNLHSLRSSHTTGLSEDTAQSGWSIGDRPTILIGRRWVYEAVSQAHLIKVKGRLVPAPPAYITTTHWSAELTTVTLNPGFGFRSSGSGGGTLSNKTFTGNTHTFTVLRVARQGSSLSMHVAASGTKSVWHTAGNAGSTFATLTAPDRDQEAAEGGFDEFDTLRVAWGSSVASLELSKATIWHVHGWTHPDSFVWSGYPTGQWDYVGYVVIQWTGVPSDIHFGTGASVDLKFTKTTLVE